MAVDEETGVVDGIERDAGSRPSRSADARGAEGRRAFTVGNVLRLLVFVALAAFLLYYVGPRNIAETTLKVVFAVVLTAALWVGANLLFDQAYAHWTRFNTLLGAALGVPRLLRRRGERLRSRRCRQAGAASPVRACSTTSPAGGRRRSTSTALLWGLIGGAALGLVMFLLSVPAAAGRALPAGRDRVHRLRAARPPSPSTSRSGRSSTGASCGSCVGRRRRRCSALDRPLARRGRLGRRPRR